MRQKSQEKEISRYKMQPLGSVRDKVLEAFRVGPHPMMQAGGPHHPPWGRCRLFNEGYSVNQTSTQDRPNASPLTKPA